MEDYGFDKYKDVRSSVPRLTLSLNKGYWIDESIDIYKLIYDEMSLTEDFSNAREAIKDLHMTVYFDRSVNWAKYHVWNRMDQDLAREDEVKDLIKDFYQAIIKVEGGKIYNSYIFYVESCVYIQALKYIIDMGYDVWMLFDAFYVKGTCWQATNQTQDDFEKVVKAAIRTSFNDFLYRAKVEGDITLGYTGEAENTKVIEIKEAVMNLDDSFAALAFLGHISIEEIISSEDVIGNDRKVYYDDLAALAKGMSTKNNFSEIKKGIFSNIMMRVNEDNYDKLLEILKKANDADFELVRDEVVDMIEKE